MSPRDRRRTRRQTAKRPLREEWITQEQGKWTKMDERLYRTLKRLCDGSSDKGH